MTPLPFVVVGLVALAIGILTLRSFGPAYRVGRLLASVPVIPVDDLAGLVAGSPRYVGIRGRIDSEEPFEDDAHRPLVFRRARIQLGSGRTWRTVDEHVQAVDFEVREDLTGIGIDHTELKDGLVVVPRESVGTAAEAPDRVPEGTAPTTPVRLWVEQLSAVEHATVLGVPRRGDADGSIVMGAGLGRPLVLTTLETPEAIRLLAHDRTKPLVAAVAIGVGLVALGIGVALALLGAMTGVASAASPDPSAGMGGDPRSSGQGPGLVGEPLVAIALVIGIGLAAAGATYLYVRMTGGRRA